MGHDPEGVDVVPAQQVHVVRDGGRGPGVAHRCVAAAVVGVLATVLLAVAGAGVAHADCELPTATSLLERGTERGTSVFVGSVREAGMPFFATIDVESVWAGPDLAPTVLVRTGPEQHPWPISEVLVRQTSVDAELWRGGRFLVVVDDEFATTLCDTLEVDASVLAAAPEDARPPTDDGLTGYRRGPFETALGPTLVLAGLFAVGLVAWGMWLDRQQDPVGVERGRAALGGVVVGAVVGLAGAALAELAAEATRQLFPTDVAVVGWTLVTGAPVTLVVATLAWWLDRPRSVWLRLALVVTPVLLAGAGQVWLQWAAQ